MCEGCVPSYAYPERQVGDEGEGGGGPLWGAPAPRHTCPAQDLPLLHEDAELQGHVRGGPLAPARAPRQQDVEPGGGTSGPEYAGGSSCICFNYKVVYIYQQA